MQTDTIKLVLFLYLFSKQVSWTKNIKTEKSSTREINQGCPCTTTPITVYSATDVFMTKKMPDTDFVLFFLLVLPLLVQANVLKNA